MKYIIQHDGKMLNFLYSFLYILYAVDGYYNKQHTKLYARFNRKYLVFQRFSVGNYLF